MHPTTTGRARRCGMAPKIGTNFLELLFAIPRGFDRNIDVIAFFPGVGQRLLSNAKRRICCIPPITGKLHLGIIKTFR